MVELETNSDGIPTKNPVTMVAKEGVPNLGCTCANFLGKSPSLLILIQIRGCPN